MVLKVGQWGTGLVGTATARKLIDHPEMELVACFAHSKTKVGQDVGAIVGTDPIGVIATDDVDTFIGSRPDCVLNTPLVWNVDDMARLLEAGINVISTANFITGRSFGEDAVARLASAARRGGVSLYGTGINPGLANIVGLAVTASCAEVRKITVREAVDATAYASKDTWTSLGFGGPTDAPGLQEIVKTRTLVFADAIEMMTDALKVRIDNIGFVVDFATADEDLDLGYMQIAKGTICGIRMTYSALVGATSLIDLQLVWRLGYAMTPDWPAEGYVIDIEGTPNVHVRVQAEKDGSGGGVVTGMNALHAIPAVCAAPPGIVTAADLPLIVAAQCVRR